MSSGGWIHLYHLIHLGVFFLDFLNGRFLSGFFFFVFLGLERGVCLENDAADGRPSQCLNYEVRSTRRAQFSDYVAKIFQLAAWSSIGIRMPCANDV